MSLVSPARSFWVPILATSSVFGAAIGGSLITSQGIESGWHAALTKPPLNPPNSVFGPVWTTLYLLIIASFWMVWRTAAGADHRYQTAFFANMTLNFAWSAVFFGMRSQWGGVAVILPLWASIIWMFRTYRPHDKTAAWMLIPYLAWVTFATYLNIGIAMLN